VLALLLVALSVGLDNFAAATALGVTGVTAKLRIQIAVIFGIFEGLMPVLGLVLGRSVAHVLGAAAKPAAGGLLGAAGLYAIISALRSDKEERQTPELGTRHLILIGVALSIDNLVIGFALGAYHVDLFVAAVVIAAVSVALSLVGLEIGSKLGTRLGERSELVGGAVLILVGIAIGVGLL
jgi:putative Mn2+ efflux pump MntP